MLFNEVNDLLHDIDINMVDKLHSLTNRALGLGLGSHVLGFGLGLGLDNQVLDNNTVNMA